MNPDSVLALLDTLGGNPGKVLIVGCEPAEIEERIGLSEIVSGAVPEAVKVVKELLDRDQDEGRRNGREGVRGNR
jgi:hydrogenase maturation protease